MISEIKNYIDSDGRMVMAKIPFTGGSDIQMGTDYMGTFYIRTPKGQMPINFEFPSGFNLEECFEKFDEFAEKTVQDMQEEAKERSRIIPATSMPKPSNNGGLILP